MRNEEQGRGVERGGGSGKQGDEWREEIRGRRSGKWEAR